MALGGQPCRTARKPCMNSAWLTLVITTAIQAMVSMALLTVPVMAPALAPVLGVPAGMLLVPATIAASCAFMMPVGTPPNAIVFGTGAVTIGQMARGGFVLNIVGIFLITMFIYLLGGVALGIVFG